MVRSSSRIVALLIVLVAAATVAGAADEAKTIVMNPQALKFETVPNLPACFTAAILRGNPRSGPAWALLQLSSGCRVPWHWHTPNDELLVISGRGTLVMKDAPSLQFAPGAYTSLPSHHLHQMSCARACLLFNSADGAFDIHYVDANGKEMSLEDALKQPQPTHRTKKKK